jgi:hypothetical protein
VFVYLQLMKELHASACAVPAADNTAGMKLYSEILRCWEAMGT